MALIVLCCILSFLGCQNASDDYRHWNAYHGTTEGIKYSSLTQIDTGNVAQLAVAWEYHTGDSDTAHSSQIQCNPIILDSILYGVSAQMKLFAINAKTGTEQWVFDPNNPSSFEFGRTAYHILINCRGITHWRNAAGEIRIFFTAGSRTYAIDAKTGRPIQSFGYEGSIDLHENLGRDVADLFVVNTSPGVVFEDLLILGTRVDEGPEAAPGHIRAYNAETGELVWIFHTIPQPGEYGYETWDNTDAWKYIGGANVWSGFTLDTKRGILFAPTGSASYDFYGGKRTGSNLFANCLLALDARTGKRLWHFQFVHHDLWDWDLSSPPALVTVTRNGKSIDAVAQSTKHGMVYVFNRETGEPLFDIEEVPVDTVSDIPGEKLWPTQPLPRLPVPFARQTLSAEDINPYLPDSVRNSLKDDLAGYRYGNMFIPPGKIPSLVFPGYDGGGEWGGPAFDPETELLYVNANEMAWILQMEERTYDAPEQESWGTAGARLYRTYCKSCHGSNREGLGNAPSLTGVSETYTSAEVTGIIENGRRMMPAMKQIGESEKKAIAAFILNLTDSLGNVFVSASPEKDSIYFMPYAMNGYRKFLSPDGYPGISPPWGTLNAIDLNSGKISWKVPLGQYPMYEAAGHPVSGTENYGGPVVTKGGLVFVAATADNRMRAFHKRTGELLWEFTLPASAFATPAIYELDGKEYVVIACGGGKLKTRSGDSYIAFALP